MKKPIKLVFQVEVFDGYTTVIITEQEYWLREGALQDHYFNKGVEELMYNLGFGRDTESEFSSLIPRTKEELHEELLNHPNFIYDESFSDYVKTGYET